MFEDIAAGQGRAGVFLVQKIFPALNHIWPGRGLLAGHFRGGRPGRASDNPVVKHPPLFIRDGWETKGHASIRAFFQIAFNGFRTWAEVRIEVVIDFFQRLDRKPRLVVCVAGRQHLVQNGSVGSFPGIPLPFDHGLESPFSPSGQVRFVVQPNRCFGKNVSGLWVPRIRAAHHAFVIGHFQHAGGVKAAVAGNASPVKNRLHLLQIVAVRQNCFFRIDRHLEHKRLPVGRAIPDNKKHDDQGGDSRQNKQQEHPCCDCQFLFHECGPFTGTLIAGRHLPECSRG